jgi:hypothetical protein
MGWESHLQGMAMGIPTQLQNDMVTTPPRVRSTYIPARRAVVGAVAQPAVKGNDRSMLGLLGIVAACIACVSPFDLGLDAVAALCLIAALRHSVTFSAPPK